MESFSKIYFSPSGGTKLIADMFETYVGKSGSEYDLLRNPQTETVKFKKKDLVIVAMPVFAGRIPKVCVDMLSKFEGNGANAVPMVVYGNREYDDALLELENILKENGFRVVAAAAFIGRHSIFPEIAEGRPDKNDKEILKEFASKVLDKIEKKDYKRVDVKGEFPYKEHSSIPLKPSSKRECIACGKCAEICPVHAINIKKTAETDEFKCISCTACIWECKQEARGFHGVMYKTAATGFGIKCSSRKEPELFL